MAPHGPAESVLQFVDPTFQVNVAKLYARPQNIPPRIPIYVIHLLYVIGVIPGNGPNQAGPNLDSARAGGEDDGSSS